MFYWVEAAQEDDAMGQLWRRRGGRGIGDVDAVMDDGNFPFGNAGPLVGHVGY